jgi:hypothetical protein
MGRLGWEGTYRKGDRTGGISRGVEVGRIGLVIDKVLLSLQRRLHYVWLGW